MADLPSGLGGLSPGPILYQETAQIKAWRAFFRDIGITAKGKRFFGKRQISRDLQRSNAGGGSFPGGGLGFGFRRRLDLALAAEPLLLLLAQAVQLFAALRALVGPTALCQ